MHEHDTQISRPHQSCAPYVVHIFAPYKFTAHDPGKTRHKSDAKRQNNVIFSRSEQSDNHKGEKYTGKRQHGVCRPHKYLIQQTTVIAGEGSPYNAEKSADCHGGKSDSERCSRSRHKYPCQNYRIPWDAARIFPQTCRRRPLLPDRKAYEYNRL